MIEILAAAVPLESVFLGKLIGRFGVALLFLAFWGSIALNFTAVLPADFATAFADIGPAVGTHVGPGTVAVVYYTNGLMNKSG